ncbi:MAG: hypothetical protein PHU44_07010 [Syntrophales bacterium]|nr:hypothetical protein [Syntrophales bacterium]MDD5640096.1 hypothetical protein [Syntrophales bacterium]
MLKRREMLRLGLTKAARILPLALAATGSLGRLMQVGAGLIHPQKVASFPAGKPEEAHRSEDLTMEEA